MTSIRCEEPNKAGVPNLPSQGVRTTLSLLLFVHLFCVLSAVGSNHQAQSPLQQRLLLKLRFYTQLLDFDLDNTPYHLTSGAPDADHFVELELIGAGGESETIVLPGGGARGEPRRAAQTDGAVAGTFRAGPRSGNRYKRFQLLADRMAYFAESEEDNATALFAQAIARHFFAVRGAERGVIRCRQHELQSMEAVDDGRRQQVDPYSALYYHTLYEADVLQTDNGPVNVVKRAATGETAPTESRLLDP